MRGCALYRGRILAGDRAGSPAEALALARHLASCGSCASERGRLEAMERELARLPEVEVPASFPQQVMARVRRAGPLAVKAGALLLAAAVVSGLLAAGGLSVQHTELLPRLPIETPETFGDTAIGFGKAVAVLLSCALQPSGSPIVPTGGHGLEPIQGAASLLLLAALVLLVGTVVLTSARSRCPGPR